MSLNPKGSNSVRNFIFKISATGNSPEGGSQTTLRNPVSEDLYPYGFEFEYSLAIHLDLSCIHQMALFSKGGL